MTSTSRGHTRRAVAILLLLSTSACHTWRPREGPGPITEEEVRLTLETGAEVQLTGLSMEGDSVYVGEADGGVTRIPTSEVRSVETRHLHRAVPWVVGGLLFIGFAAVSVVTSFWDS